VFDNAVGKHARKSMVYGIHDGASCNTGGLGSLNGGDTTGLTVDGSVRELLYSDGTTQMLQLLEHSDAKYTVTWDVIVTEPACPVMSQVHTITLMRVTDVNHTYIEWHTDFSSDVTQAVDEDSKWKKLDSFQVPKPEPGLARPPPYVIFLFCRICARHCTSEGRL
jgi:hypothetical protein